ncbi:hypothetical protein [Pseudonocardia acaciae]|uniref:hypothetical protein n=1 Tax=Pseudonocardia acaciae TaxID=551276 RepID=UPI0012EE10DB|nr:hypothetical protein [Pseudonocardia acaciae]
MSDGPSAEPWHCGEPRPVGREHPVWTYLAIIVGTAVVAGLVVHHWYRGQVGDVMVGLVLGVALAMAAAALRRVGGGRFVPRQRLTFRLAADSAEARELAVAALRELSARRVRAENPLVVEAWTGMSWQSWGERVRIELWPVEGMTDVVVSSNPRLWLTLVDWGKGRGNVETVARGMRGLMPG